MLIYTSNSTVFLKCLHFKFSQHCTLKSVSRKQNTKIQLTIIYAENQQVTNVNS